MKLKAGVTRGEVKELEALLERVGDASWVRHKQQCGVGLATEYDDEDGDPTMYFP